MAGLVPLVCTWERDGRRDRRDTGHGLPGFRRKPPKEWKRLRPGFWRWGGTLIILSLFLSVTLSLVNSCVHCSDGEWIQVLQHQIFQWISDVVSKAAFTSPSFDPSLSSSIFNESPISFTGGGGFQLDSSLLPPRVGDDATLIHYLMITWISIG